MLQGLSARIWATGKSFMRLTSQKFHDFRLEGNKKKEKLDDSWLYLDVRVGDLKDVTYYPSHRAVVVGGKNDLQKNCKSSPSPNYFTDAKISSGEFDTLVKANVLVSPT